jgi:hypothetical protein
VCLTKTPRFPATAQPPAKKQALGGAAAMDPAGIKKPSPGFLLKAEGSLTPLNNAHIEVRRDPSSPTSPGRFFAFPPLPRVFLRAFPRETGRAAAVASHATRWLSGAVSIFFPLSDARSFRPPRRAEPLVSSPSRSSPFLSQLYWPDDGMWYKAEVVSLNLRARSAKVLYATGDVETLAIDEIAAEGHLNVCA